MKHGLYQTNLPHAERSGSCPPPHEEIFPGAWWWSRPAKVKFLTSAKNAPDGTLAESSRYGVKPLLADAKKIPSYGQLLRRLRNIEARILTEQRQRAYVLGKEIEAAALRDAEEEVRRAELAGRLADLQDSIRIAASL